MQISDIWTAFGGGGNVKKVAVIGASWKTPGETVVSDGMDVLLMALSTMGRMFSEVVGFLGS